LEGKEAYAKAAGDLEGNPTFEEGKGCRTK
jgi:hypothetical protein